MHRYRKKKQKKTWSALSIYPEIQLKKRHLLSLAALRAFQSRIKFSLLDRWTHRGTAFKTGGDVTGYDSIQPLTHPLIMIIDSFQTSFPNALGSPSRKSRKLQHQHTSLCVLSDSLKQSPLSQRLPLLHISTCAIINVSSCYSNTFLTFTFILPLMWLCWLGHPLLLLLGGGKVHLYGAETLSRPNTGP